MMYYAHSPKPKKNIPAQSYTAHVNNVVCRAVAAAGEVSRYAKLDGENLQAAVKQAALFHDLGKLDTENQKVLSGNKKAKSLPVQHTDAGAAYFFEDTHLSLFSAAAIQAHHIGYPDFIDEELKQEDAFRDTGFCKFAQTSVRERTDKTLDSLVATHQSAVTDNVSVACNEIKGNRQIFLRLLLSCLADADHTDTAVHYGEYPKTEPRIELRPAERLKKLDAYVASLGKTDDARSQLRREMYDTCRDSQTESPINSCDSPVGSGKTTAIMANLLHEAERRGLRRIIVVLPFTNIITQSVATYRKALCLDNENPEEVVAELHHRADFQNAESRHLTSLWHAPVIVTTAVAFFETLASNTPSALRRLHQLPGSAIFVDESHAALPPHLLPLAWKWINIYAAEWSCYWVLASGSLCRFWQIDEIAQKGKWDIPELINDDLRTRLSQYENRRIEYHHDLQPKDTGELAAWITSFPGPRLVIMNTVQSAAVLADYFAKQYGFDKVEHLSTALTPIDREKTINRVKERLSRGKHYQKKYKVDTDWTFIATSCVEAGVDISFRTGFRELGSTVSLLQTAGRVNRENEYSDSQIWTFKVAEGGLLKTHPMLKDAADILQKYFEHGVSIEPKLSTQSIKDEIILGGKVAPFKKLLAAETCQRFPTVEKDFKVINTDTRMVVVDKNITERIKHYEKVMPQEIQKNSVMIWGYKLTELNLPEICEGIYEWNLAYDDFLGYMAGIVSVEKFKEESFAII
ncbi:MAG: CRISPR-associated endonuclease Cas3'' [Planctomycetaceae bacterium]|jgi:CRISPR-associated endonuclease Cas3-HD|nr:CRISPR-associated endonuclease Cas3'' [Planctomycetaceae bacterium]